MKRCRTPRILLRCPLRLGVICCLCACFTILAQEDNANKPKNAPPPAKQQERQAATIKLPGAVRHEVLKSGKHRYTVRTQAEPRKKSVPAKTESKPGESRPATEGYHLQPDVFASLHKMHMKLIPGCTDLTESDDGRDVIFETDAEVPNLKQAIDRVASFGGLVPYWEELEARDLRSPEFKDGLFRLVEEAPTSGNWILAVRVEKGRILLTLASGLLSFAEGGESTTTKQDYALSLKNGRLTLEAVSEVGNAPDKDLDAAMDGAGQPKPMRYGKGLAGTASLNPTYPHCMAESRFALRIFDRAGKFIWEDLTHVFGQVQIAIADVDADGADEILVTRNDHGKCSLLVFQRSEDTESRDRTPKK